MKVYKKAILPVGFRANGIPCGIKRSGKPDIALFYSQRPAQAACVFTTSTMPAAPIHVNRLQLARRTTFRAILANSGNANCYTGTQGIRDSLDTAAAAAAALGVSPEEVLVSSTGIIGKRMPVDTMVKGIPALVKGLARSGMNPAARAIMTTDTFPKVITVQYPTPSGPITICGAAKGAGMISPDMATMLAFIMTDAALSSKAFKSALKSSVDSSFNCVTVDGCMSTNDSVMALANGAAGAAAIDISAPGYGRFVQALGTVCLELAKMIARDGEGATKFITIKVSGARNFGEARRCALAVANSNLFKTAVYGENPNFGRIVAAIGASGTGVREHDLRMNVSSLKKRDVFVDIALGRGDETATVYTSDLTPEYVKINAEYS